MKPSHRKDVIIARIIFAFICLALIGIIAAIVVTVSSHHKSTVKDTQTTETESQEKDIADESIIDNGGVDTEAVVEPDTQTVTEVYVMTTSNVNLRLSPSLDASILATIPIDTQIQILSEQDGWAEVVYDNQTGYISTEYIVEVSSGEGDASTADDALSE